MFEIKIGYYLELLTPETMKLLESSKSEITKDENCETAPHLEITEVILVHCNIFNNNCQHSSRVTALQCSSYYNCISSFN